MPETGGLIDIIKAHIRLHGPMDVETYWNLCLAHPQHGYYRKQDPLGMAGDFITAPEISQLFGEMIGIWAATQWQNLGSPTKLHVVECGPGRGTLMTDLLRIAQVIPNFRQSINIHLIETSPVLRAKQHDALHDYHVQWHDVLATVPDDEPCLIIGNEFLDALPIRQYVMQGGTWFAQRIGLNENGQLMWGLSPTTDVIAPPNPAEDGEVWEYSPAREKVFDEICARLTTQGGGCLMIDYGHDVSGLGDTLQAVKNHDYVDVLSDCGDADITSHVDFGRLTDMARSKNLAVRLGGQGDFLRAHGIIERAAQLQEKADMQMGLHRLIDDAHMGKLFRVLECTNEKTSS